MMNDRENKFKVNEVVSERNGLIRELVVRRYVDHIYYCTDASAPGGKDLVFFERELISCEKRVSADVQQTRQSRNSY
jgi:hypothetical protein